MNSTASGRAPGEHAVPLGIRLSGTEGTAIGVLGPNSLIAYYRKSSRLLSLPAYAWGSGWVSTRASVPACLR